MPIFNLFKNSAYYWGFAAAIGYPLVTSAYVAPSRNQVLLGLGLWVASQLTNLAVHLQLSGMRKEEGDRSRAPPSGFLFSLVTSPNYTAEVLGWVGWTVLSQVGMGAAFTVVGLLQMGQWARDKYKGYLKTDLEYAKARKAIIPFLL